MKQLSPKQRALIKKRREGLVHKAPSKIPPVRNEMNVTPLVDVCLVLLIIFMVITELLTRGHEVDLPKTRNHQEQADQNQPIVAVDVDGKVYYEKDKDPVEVPLGKDGRPDYSKLQKRIREGWQLASSKDQRVYLKADAQTEYKLVYPVIMAIHDMGVNQIDLGTHELKDEEP